MTVKEIIQNFYNDVAQKNSEWQKYLAPDILFSDANKKLHAEGKEAFIQSFNNFLLAVQCVQLKDLIIEGDTVCAIVSYDYVSPKGTELHQDVAEVWRVVNGKIVALTIYFDLTEFRNFMGR